MRTEKLNLNKTIVLVGSLILGSSKNSDAPFNLGYAICTLQFLKPEVYVAMNGDIFHWNNVRKNLKTNRFERKMKNNDVWHLNPLDNIFLLVD